MDKIDDSIRGAILKFAEKLEKKYSVSQIYLYGSYASGSSDKWSDIDLAVIIDSDEPDSREIYSMGKELDIRFDALSFSASDFEQSNLPIIPQIKSQGVQIV